MMKMRKWLQGALFTVLLSLLAGSVVAQTQEQPAAKALLNEKGLVHLDFTDVEIRDVVKAVSKITGKNFVLDDRVRGKITIISPEPVTVKEAYEAFVSALEVKNFTVVTEGKVTKLIPIREAKSSPIPSEPTAEVPFGAGFITRLIPIKYISANEIALSLKSLVSANGSITAYGPTNSLIVTDSASNIRRLMKIISKLDRRGFQEGIEVIPLSYASATDIAKILLQLFQLDKAKPKATPKRRSRGSVDIEGGQVISKIIPDERTNSLVVIANREGIEKVLNVVRRLDHEIEVEEGKGRIHVHYLKHADAEEMAKTLSGLTADSARSSARRTPTTQRRTGTTSRNTARPAAAAPSALSLFEGQVKIAPDLATNSLVISASPQDYESLKPIIKKLDIRRRQVFVEALILEVNLDRALEVGLEGTGGEAFGSSADNLLFGGTLLGGLNPLTFTQEGLAAQAASQGATGVGGVFGVRGRTVDVPGFGEIPLFGAVFRALQANTVLSVLSTPNILTTDNKPAKIHVGRNVPIKLQDTLDQSGQPIQSFDRRDVGINLQVTPQINESDFVTMEIEQTIEDIIPAESETGLPVFNKREANTTVVVEDGQTVVIGGLISETETDIKRKVPLLGDIPLLGWLFQSKSKSNDKTNLMIFITPSIVKDSMDIANVTREKEIQRQRFNRRNRIDDPSGYRGYGIKQRMQIDRKGSGRPQSRRIDRGGDRRYGQGDDNEENTAAYVESYVVGSDAEEELATEAGGEDSAATPFGEIVPPSSE